MAQDYEVATVHLRMGTLINQTFQAVPNAATIVSTLLINAIASTEDNVQIFNQNLPVVVDARAAPGKLIALMDMSSNSLSIAGLHAERTYPTDKVYFKMAKAIYNGIVGLCTQISFPLIVAVVENLGVEEDVGVERR